MKLVYTPDELAMICKLTVHAQNDNDMIIAISGHRGVGKSVLAMQLMRRLIGPSYYTHDGFFYYNLYQPEELTEKLDKSPPETPFMVDEAINVLFKRDFAKKKQKVNIQIFNTHRDKRHILFLLVPNFWDLDSAVRNSLIVKIWIHCHTRGQGWMFTHSHNPVSEDPWARKRLFKNYLSGRIESSRTCLGSITWKKVPDDVYEVYKKVKADKRLAEEDKPQGKLIKDKAKQLYDSDPVQYA